MLNALLTPSAGGGIKQHPSQWWPAIENVSQVEMKISKAYVMDEALITLITHGSV